MAPALLPARERRLQLGVPEGLAALAAGGSGDVVVLRRAGLGPRFPLLMRPAAAAAPRPPCS